MKRALFSVPFLFLVFIGVADAAQWRMDPAASRLDFRASYEGADAPGAFKQFDTRLRFDPARPAGSQLQVTVKLSSIDMGSAELNDGVREPEWFDLKRFPEAEFTSADIQQTAPGRYVARGTLKLKDSQQPVTVPFTWKESGKSADMTGNLTLNRTSFNVGTGEWKSGNVIGLDVKVAFTVRLNRID